MRARNEELWVEWAKRVERWGESGLTAAEFAAEIGVDAKALTTWKWKLRAEQKRAVGTVVSASAESSSAAPTAESSSAAPSLRLVPSAESSSAAPTAESSSAAPKRAKPAAVTAPTAPEPLEVVFANGVTLRVTKDFDESTLLRVVGLLGGKQ